MASTYRIIVQVEEWDDDFDDHEIDTHSSECVLTTPDLDKALDIAANLMKVAGNEEVI